MKNLVVIQEFIDNQHTRYKVGNKISAKAEYADKLIKKKLVEEVLTEEELKAKEKADAQAKEDNKTKKPKGK